MNHPTHPTIRRKSLAHFSAIEQIERTSTAWRTHAPEAKFADKNWAEFRSATEMSRFYRSQLATLNSKIKGGISDRDQADRVTRALLKRIAWGVKIDQSYGPNSSLYRAMGYIPEYEQKRRGAAPATEEAAVPKAKAPSAAAPSLMTRLAKMRSAWAELAPNADLAGITLPQFDEAVAPSHATREGLEAARTNLRAAVGARDNADASLLALVRQVIRSITAATAYGSDCALYRALGFIPDSERRTNRRSATEASPAAPAQ